MGWGAANRVLEAHGSEGDEPPGEHPAMSEPQARPFCHSAIVLRRRSGSLATPESATIRHGAEAGEVRVSVRLAVACAFVVSAVAVVAGPASAQSQGTSEQRNACMGDAFRYCLSEIPNHKRIEACLRANRRSLSSACFHEIYDDDVPPQRTAKKVMPNGSHAPE
jgi:hypothetical protein